MKATLYGLTKNKNDIHVKSQLEKMLSQVSAEGAVVIDGANIAAESIYGKSIVAGSIEATQIKAGAITSDHITAKGIVADKIKTGTLSSTNGVSWLNLNDGTFSYANGNFTFQNGKMVVRAQTIELGGQEVPTKTQTEEYADNLGKTLQGQIDTSIKSTEVEYYSSTSKTSPVGGVWSTTAPEWKEGRFMWSRTKITPNKGNVIYKPNETGTNISGATGNSAKIVNVTPSAQLFWRNQENAVTPATITVDGSVQNTTISAWQYSVDGGSFTTKLPTGVTHSGNKVTLTGATVTARTIAIKALDASGNTDTTTIAMIQDGNTGENSIVGYLTNESVTLGASSTGAVDASSFTTAGGTFRVFDGITEVTTNSACVFSLNASAGVTLTINSAGVYTVTAMNADTATAEFKAVYKNITIIKTMSLSKSRVGATGGQGAKGADGKGISSAVVTYQNHTNGTTAPTGTWSNNPSPVKGQYLWTRTVTTYTEGNPITTYAVAYNALDGQKGATGETGGKGNDGTGISSTVIRYFQSTSGTTTPSGDGSTTPPTPIQGQYNWTRTVITYTNGTNSTAWSTSYNAKDGLKGDKGDTGSQGPQGIQGPTGANGTSQYIHIRYSTDSNGNPMDDKPSASTLYIGIANTTTSTAPTGYASYAWSLYKGEKGDQGVQGPSGANGQPTYTWIKYADTDAGVGMSDSPIGKKYIGMAFNKTTATESTTVSQYTWSLMPQNIEIGGRNLLLDSGNINFVSSTKENHLGKTAITWVAPISARYTNPVEKYSEPFIVGQPYTFSFLTTYEGIKGTDLNLHTGSGLFGYTPVENFGNVQEGKFTRVWVTATPTVEGATSRFHITYNGTGKLYVADFKVEKGNVATDWTEAPEDVQERIGKKADIEAVNNLKNETIPALKDGLLNSSEKEVVKQSLNVVSADKKGIDMQYTTVYANAALTGTAKSNLKSAKDALNTAFTNLQSAINAVLGVGDGTRITTTQMTLVTTRLNEYGTALSTYNQRYEQAQDAISTEKKRLGDAYALAQATLAETQAKAHADGKVTAEEKRAIADAQAKLDEAKKYVDDMEIGGRNLVLNTGRKLYITFGNGATLSEVDGATRLGWTGTSQTSMGEKLSTPLVVGETYTLTFEARGTIAGPLLQVYILASSGANLNISDSLNDKIVTEEFKKYTATFKFTGSPSDRLFIGGQGPSGRWLEVKDSTVKLEKGNKATGWTEAPEDVEFAQNKKVYNPVRYIRDWSNGSSANTSNHWFEIMANDTSGTNVAQGKTVTTNGTASNLGVITDGLVGGTYSSTGIGKHYVEIDLGSVYHNIASVSTWHYYVDNRTYYETRTEVSEDGVNWYPLFDSLIEGEYAETAAGQVLPNTKAKSESLISALNTAKQLANTTSKVVINGGNITAGSIKDKNSRNTINLDNGTFTLANGNIVYNGSTLEIKSGVSFSTLDSAAQTKINNGDTAKATLDSKVSTWDTVTSKATPAQAQGYASTAETNAKTHANLVTSVKSLSGTAKKFINPASFDTTSGNVTGYVIIRTPITNPFMTKLKISGYNYVDGKTDIDLDVGFYAYTNSILQKSYTSRGDFPINKVQVGRDSSGRAVVVLGEENTAYSYPTISIDEAVLSYSTAPDSYKDGWSISISSSLTGITGITNVEGFDTKKIIDQAQSTATNAKSKTDAWTYPSTTEINGSSIRTGSLSAAKITTGEMHGDRITAGTLKADRLIAGSLTIGYLNSDTQSKINNGNSAKATLDSKASLWDAKLTDAQVTAKILSDKEIKDTRTTNQNPAWYFSNYPNQIVREFKNVSVMGVGSGTYGILTTDIPWNSSAGGSVKQTFRTNTEEFKRDGTTTSWSAWVNHDAMAANAESKANQIENKINNAVTTIDAEGVTVQDGNFFLKDIISESKYTVTPKTNYILFHSFEIFRKGAGQLGGDDESPIVPQFRDNINSQNPWINILDPTYTLVGGTDLKWEMKGNPSMIHHAFSYSGLAKKLSIFGDKSVVVSNSGILCYRTYNIEFTAGNTLTLSIHFKRRISDTSTGKLIMKVSRAKTSGTSESYFQSTIAQFTSKSNATENIQRMSGTFTIPDGYNYLNECLKIEFFTTTGKIVIDGAQLVDGLYPTLYNDEDPISDVSVGRRSLNILSSETISTEQIHIFRDARIGGNIVIESERLENSLIKVDPFYSNAGIELGSTKIPSTPFIDFHSSGHPNDYDARIFATSGLHGAIGQGLLDFQSRDIMVNGTGVVSSGANDNGTWIKFYDGTLICTSRLTIAYANDMVLQFAWRLPHVFVNENFRVTASFLDSSPMRNVTPIAFGARGPGIVYISCQNISSAFTASSSAYAEAIAIGRWK